MREEVAGARLLPYLAASALLPYLVACLGAVQFTWIGLAQVAALPLMLGLWFRVLPRWSVVDIAFLGVVVAVKLGRFATPVYATRFPELELTVLGDLALLQIAVMVLMVERRIPESGYGFLPSRKDWRIGILNFCYFLPIGFGLGFALHAVKWSPTHEPWKPALQFFGWLFVLALAEEFFFRGVLQRWFEDWTRSPQLALAMTSLLFGGVHLWYRHFPNWKWVIIAGVMGWFCGRARNQAGSIRAAMVTHALVVTAQKAFFPPLS